MHQTASTRSLPIPVAPDSSGHSPGVENVLGAVVRRLQGRDPTALAELYDHTVSRVMALARVMLRNQSDAEELVCEVYQRAWLKADRFDATRGTVLAWLLTICRSQALDLLRKRRKLMRTREALEREPEKTDSSGPEELLECFQRGHCVHAALAALPPLRRQMIALAFFKGLSHKEIAAELTLPLGTVKSHLRRALLELRGRLGLDEYNHET